MSQSSRLNETFIRWLQEWKNSAERSGSQMLYVYRKALKSLQAHKEDVLSPNDLRAIKNFGPVLCKRLEARLKESCESDQETRSLNERQKSEPKRAKVKTPQQKKDQSKANKSKRPYCPAKHSGGYGILIALYKASQNGQDSVPKNELIQNAQPYCRESLTVAKQRSHYTAWNSMKTLIQHGYVEKEVHRHAFFSLTESGMSLAEAITKNHEKQCPTTVDDCNTPDSCDSSESEESEMLLQEEKLSSHTFDIVLIVDSREQFTQISNDIKKTMLVSELQRSGIAFEVKALPVGDFAWVARAKPGLNTNCRKDLVLDYVVERKRLDDLVKSIKDNRWREQKMRLKNSGIRKPMYLIEDFNFDFRKQDYQAIQQAVIDAQVVDGLSVKCTKNLNETLSWLIKMTNHFKLFYSGHDLYSCSRQQLTKNEASRYHFMAYSEFERSSEKMKVFTNSEMFLKHLLTFRGVSLSKAKAITEHYKTISHLYDAYEICEDEKSKEELLACLKWGERKIGPAISRKICQFYCSNLQV